MVSNTLFRFDEIHCAGQAAGAIFKVYVRLSAKKMTPIDQLNSPWRKITGDYRPFTARRLVIRLCGRPRSRPPHTVKIVHPVVLRASRSRWAWATSSSL
jgi:hypothetical protein